MKNRWVIITVVLHLLNITFITGQEEERKKTKWLYVETGVDFMYCDAPDDKSYIRAENTPNSYYYENSYVMALLYRYHASVKFEKKAIHDKLGIMGGIRYSRIESSIGKEEYWNSGSDYFFVLVNQQGTTSEYLMVKDIVQLTNYLGVPIDLRFYPYENRKIQFYYKIGFDVNFQMGSKTNVSFKNAQMNAFEKDVTTIVEEAWPFYASMHLGAGLKIGSFNKSGINMEACVPAFMLYSNRSSSFVDPIAGGGVQISFRIPL